MGTERFTKITPQVGEGDGRIQPVAQAWGDPVTGKGRVNSPGQSDTIKPAGLFSTAPYQPSTKNKLGSNGCRGKFGECSAYPVKGTDYCIFHTPRKV